MKKIQIRIQLLGQSVPLIGEYILDEIVQAAESPTFCEAKGIDARGSGFGEQPIVGGMISFRGIPEKSGAPVS